MMDRARAKGAAFMFTVSLAYFAVMWLSETGHEVISALLLWAVILYSLWELKVDPLYLYEPLVGGEMRLRAGWWALAGGLAGVLAGWLASEAAGLIRGVEPPIGRWELGVLVAILMLGLVPSPLREGGARRAALEALSEALSDLKPAPSRRRIVDAWLRVVDGEGAELAREAARLQRRLKKLRDQAEIFRARFHLHETRGVPLEDWIPQKAEEVEAEIREVERRLEEVRAELVERFRRALSSAS